MAANSPARSCKRGGKAKGAVNRKTENGFNGDSVGSHEMISEECRHRVELPTKVFDEIHRVLDGRESPPTPEEESLPHPGMLNITDFEETRTARGSLSLTATASSDPELILDQYVKDINIDLGSGRCIVCHRQHTPENGPTDLTPGDNPSLPQLFLWICSGCKKIIEKERDSTNCSVTLKVTATASTGKVGDGVGGGGCAGGRGGGGGDGGGDPSATLISTSYTSSIATQTANSEATNQTNSTSSTSSIPSCNSANSCNSSNSINGCSSCSCHTCKKLEHEDLKYLWQELKLAILRIYRDTGLVLSHSFMQQNKLDFSSHSKFPLPSNERLKEVVHRLCVHDRHKLYQCLEAQVRLFVVEMRINLLKHLEHGSQALFEAMIEQYSKLCKASKRSAQFLQELETRHLRKFNLTWEFLNRRLFQSTVYCDPFIKHGLPKLTALTKDRSLIDMYARFLKFEDEMTVISVVWREAQQFIDKYEKYAIINKKKALLKEWEQLSVEWVLDEEQKSNQVHGKGNGKQSCGESTGPSSASSSPSSSYTCLKKSSIECLNARFLEEQKMLKSGKSMQSVNLSLESQNALQEQLLLSAYGEWDSVDVNSLAAAAAAHSLSCFPKHQRSASTSTQVDMLLNSNSSKIKLQQECDEVVDSSDNEEEDDDEDDEEDDEDPDDDEEDEEEDEEEDDDEDDPDEEDEEDEDSCSDHSSTTSTSTSNNTRGDGGRVCDCCYCEVFGHGMPAVAPTSRNYTEMRERLRMRLSKRKAERGCENNPHNPVGPAVKKKQEPIQTEVEDKRDLEELINFINGTDEGANGKDKKKKDKQKKKKEKKEKQKEKKSNTSKTNSAPNRKEEAKLAAECKEREKSCEESSSHRSNKENSWPKDTKAKLNGALPEVNSNPSSAESTREMAVNSKKKPANCEKKPHPVEAKSLECNGIDHKVGENKQTHLQVHAEEAKRRTPSRERRNQKEKASASVCNGVHPPSGYKLVVNNIQSQTQDKCKMSVVSSSERSTSATLQSRGGGGGGKDVDRKTNRTKGKKKTDEAISPDEVFLPKDIDLENGELDELEKELEAFKRFCFNSVPLARKEKVNVNLKDIFVKKRGSLVAAANASND